MKYIKNIGLIMVSMLLTALFLVNAGIVKANPQSFIRKQSATATTSPTYLVRGGALATTTLVYDSGVGNSTVDSVALALQFTASSTGTILNWRYEYSPGTPDVDCTSNQGGCDWYSDNIFVMTNATNTPTNTVGVPVTYSWQYASSTDICGPTTSTVANSGDRRCKSFTIPTHMRYIRTTFFLTSAQNGAVYSEFISKKQNP